MSPVDYLDEVARVEIKTVAEALANNVPWEQLEELGTVSAAAGWWTVLSLLLLAGGLFYKRRVAISAALAIRN